MPLSMSACSNRDLCAVLGFTATRALVHSGDDGEEEIIHAPSKQNEFAEVETRIWFDGFLKAGAFERERFYRRPREHKIIKRR